MMLDVKEVARLLNVSDNTVYRWISRKALPAYKIGEAYRFNRVELLEWATASGVNVSCEIFSEKDESVGVLPELKDALENGGIHYGVPGSDIQSVLRSIVGLVNLPDDIDREFLFGALLAREDLGTTAIGDGIAIPHVRNPIIFHIDKPIIAICFLEQSVDFKALDGKPVKTIFTLLTSTVRMHLHLLSRLGYILNILEVRRSIVSKSGRQQIMDAIVRAESKIRNPGSLAQRAGS